jgi:hypothetical protein
MTDIRAQVIVLRLFYFQSVATVLHNSYTCFVRSTQKALPIEHTFRKNLEIKTDLVLQPIFSVRLLWPPPFTVAERSMNCLRSLGRWNCRFESHSRHKCLCAFILCVGSGLATSSSPVQGVLTTVYRIKKLKKRPRSNKGLQSQR